MEDAIIEARRRVDAAEISLATAIGRHCPQHFALEHGDGKPPWCDSCGYGWDGVKWQEMTVTLIEKALGLT